MPTKKISLYLTCLRMDKLCRKFRIRALSPLSVASVFWSHGTKATVWERLCFFAEHWRFTFWRCVWRHWGERGGRYINRAIELGLNFFDTSPFYGITKSETVMGKAFQKIPRDKFFICSKVKFAIKQRQTLLFIFAQLAWQPYSFFFVILGRKIWFE